MSIRTSHWHSSCRVDTNTVLFGHSCKRWLCIFGNPVRGLGPPTGRYFGKQTNAKAAQSARLLRMRQHPRPVALCDKTNYVLPGGWRFWVKYVGKEHAEHLINCLKEENINSQKIGQGTYTAASRSDGITRHKTWIFWCQDISKNNC